jgi:TonB family protein
VAGELVETEVLPERPLPPALLPPPRAGRVIESPGAAEEQTPQTETDRIAERNADTEEETRRGARSREPGQRAPVHRAARAAAAEPAAPAPPQPGAGVPVPAPDAGVAQTSADGGARAAAAAEPGGVPNGITVGIGAHAEDEPVDVPLGDDTRLRANVSSYASFINIVRDRVRRVWRVREVYQQADPGLRYRGDALVTEVAVRVAADGSVASATVQKGSGLDAVDEEAAAALRRAGPFPAPAGITDPQGGFTVPDHLHPRPQPAALPDRRPPVRSGPLAPVARVPAGRRPRPEHRLPGVGPARRPDHPGESGVLRRRRLPGQRRRAGVQAR